MSKLSPANLVWLATFFYCIAVGQLVYPNHDCCRENIYPRSANQLVISAQACVTLCQEDSRCNAAVLVNISIADTASQCNTSIDKARGRACCIYKKTFDNLHTKVGCTAIDITPSCCSPEQQRPRYHFTREKGEMNDPNGLQYQILPDKSIEYHMFFQMGDSKTCGPPKWPPNSHVWGHARSNDLVHWTRMQNSTICGSTGGGITLPTGFQSGWKAANIASVPTNPPKHPATGLKLWTSIDEHLYNWTEYQPNTTNKIHDADPCVICPDIVPDSVGAGYIGDNYVWSEPRVNVNNKEHFINFHLSDTNGTTPMIFYVLSGSNKCPNNGTWCGYPARGATPQALLFKSFDLLKWQFVNVFWDGPFPFPHYNRVDTPDTFTLPEAKVPEQSQVLLWLTSGGTRWNIGSFNRTTGKFVSNITGFEEHGDMSCGQSMWDYHGRRVQFGWVHLNIAGSGFTGAQSLPRIITARTTATGLLGLFFEPLPELSSLHGEHRTFNFNVSSGETKQVLASPTSDQFGLYHHCIATVTIPTKSKNSMATIMVLQSHDMKDGLPIRLHFQNMQKNQDYSRVFDNAMPRGNYSTLMLTVANYPSVPINVLHMTPVPAINVELQIFVDGAVVEVFANKGERVISAVAQNPSGGGISLAVEGNENIQFNLNMWEMKASIS